MGGKRTGKRQRVFLCLAGLACLWSCAARDARLQQAAESLALARQSLSQGQFPEAVRLADQVVALSSGKPPSDEALFYAAASLAHPANPQRDAATALALFRRVLDGYPQSRWAAAAASWIAILEERESLAAQLRKLRAEQESAAQAARKLRDENEQLHRLIQKLKQVDIEIEEKRRGMGR
jgi:outer membrane protein assembly factor BamD (BamD/ComL family)